MAINLLRALHNENVNVCTLVTTWKSKLAESIRNSVHSEQDLHIQALSRCCKAAALTLEPLTINLRRTVMFLRMNKPAASRCLNYNHSSSLLQLNREWKHIAVYLESVETPLLELQQSTQYVFQKMSFIHSAASVLQESYRLQMVKKRERLWHLLTSVKGLFTMMGVSASIYGMNFDNMPEVHSETGYYWWWTINIIVIITLIWWFKRSIPT